MPGPYDYFNYNGTMCVDIVAHLPLELEDINGKI
jgi:hypothetical protein